jgi:hypothetical protein
MPLWSDSDGKPIRRQKALSILAVSLLIILIPVTLLLLAGSNGEGLEQGELDGGVKSAGLKVVGLVFYGRRANVQVLERYLRVPTPSSSLASPFCALIFQCCLDKRLGKLI